MRLPHPTFQFIVGLFLLAFISPHATYGQLTKGDRTLGWQVDMAEDADYNAAFLHAEEACVESVHLFFTWPSLEPDTGEFDTDFIDAFLKSSNLYYPAKGVKAELQIAPVNTTTLEVPASLEGVDFDDPIMINRFKRALDTVFKYLPDLELVALNIGNESDAYFGNDSASYAAFKVFLDAVIPHAKQLYQNLHGTDLRVGTTFTLEGLIHAPRSSFCAMVNSGRDVVTTTYYPINGDFTMKDPSVVADDFQALINQYSDTAQAIHFAECGYASSEVCNSSEARQAEFYKAVFEAWDQHADRITYLTLFKSTDWSQAEVEILGQYYGISNTVFLEYLRTLGVRTWHGSGTDKLAYDQIRCLLDERDWCATTCIPLQTVEIDNADAFDLFPNPARDVLHVRLADDVQFPAALSLYNSLGQLVDQFTLHQEINMLDLTPYATGLYYIELTAPGQKAYKQKIIIDK